MVYMSLYYMSTTTPELELKLEALKTRLTNNDLPIQLRDRLLEQRQGIEQVLQWRQLRATREGDK